MERVVAGSTAVLNDRAALLAAFADTLVPSIGGESDYLRRAATDLLPPETLAGIATSRYEPVLAELEAAGFAELELEARTRLVVELGARGGETRQLVRELKGTVMGLFYALPENPNWPALGYPGPISEPPDAPKTIRIETVTGSQATLTADVCIVGSGAGGSVIAAELQQAGPSVVVLERAQYRNEADFRQLELVGAEEMLLRGGLFFSDTGAIGLLAGATLGGGTVINSMVCLRPPERILAEWRAMGLDLDGFSDHLDAVSRRINVNTEATNPNRVNEMMLEALEERGLPGEILPRNASLDDDPRYCGYCNAGCQQGCKQSTLKTYLQDASDSGARIVVGCAVERVLVRDGRAAGVVATVGDTELTVEAPVVVVAAGGLESPALLLRSGIGGPAVGKYLRLHPTYFVTGLYDEEVRSWDGQFQATVSFAFAEAVEGSGFLVESVNLSLPFFASSMAFTGGAAHKERMLDLRHAATWHAVSHDTGSGEVVLDGAGEPVVRWSLGDPIDRAVAERAHVELARLHQARGAREIFTFHWDDPAWREGEDFDAYVARLEAATYEGLAFSAHQMGSCRLGADPATSVADPRGELHDVPGVWIGDASALPTAPGVNPMVTIMALARRTATAIRGEAER